MANQNICEVELLTGITEDTNGLVEENGILRRINLIDMIYPIGSIYMSINDTDPSIIFGGVWERIKDKFLLSAGDTYEAGTTGGEATHTLTTEEIPSHAHELYGNSFIWGDGSCNIDIPNAVAVAGAPTANTLCTKQHFWNRTKQNGGGKPHNNMPPYLAVNVYVRIS